MIIEVKKISELKEAPYNPRKSNKKQDSNLKASLEKFGVVEPIVFNKRTGYIVGGHFRVRELRKLGYTEVECVIVDLSIEDEKELNIRLNANTGEWDFDILNLNFDKLEVSGWGMDTNIDFQFNTRENTGSRIKKEDVRFKSYVIPITKEQSIKLVRMIEDYVSENTVLAGFLNEFIEKYDK